MLEKVAGELSDELAEDGMYGFDWELILEFVMEILVDCFNNEDELMESARNPTRLQKAALSLKIRREGLARGWKASRKFRNKMLAKSAEMSEEQLCGCYQEAYHTMYGD
jgi:hypothetical protein